MIVKIQEVANDIENNLVLALSAFWQLFMEEKLEKVLRRKVTDPVKISFISLLSIQGARFRVVYKGRSLLLEEKR